MSHGSSSSDDDCYGPALPPHLLQRQQEPVKPSIIGPCLPAGLLKPNHDHDSSEDGETHNGLSPQGKQTRSEVLPEELDEDDDEEEDDDDEVIGPLPPDHPLALARAAAFDAAGSGRNKGRDEDDVKPRREEWMLIPPKNKSVTELGLGPRKFLNRAPAAPVKDDGTAMDAANSDEEFERQTKEEMDQQIIDSYDKTMEAMINKSSGGGKRKAESLLEIHQKEMKKKAKEAAKKAKEAKRKPFDRNTDLSVSGLTKEDSKKYIEKSRELGGRFQKGRQKFL